MQPLIIKNGLYLNDVNKADRPKHGSYGSCHVYICRLFNFSVFRPFCRFTLVYEGHFVLCYREKTRPLDRATANFKRS